MKHLVYIVPAIAFLVLAFFLFEGLRAPPPGDLPSVLIDKPAPAVTLPALDAKVKGFGPSELAGGRVTIVNVFASWCLPCRAEAPQLAQLGRARGVQLFGIVWKDTAVKARTFCSRSPGAVRAPGELSPPDARVKTRLTKLRDDLVTVFGVARLHGHEDLHLGDPHSGT